jgi:myo-inositol-1(or 4)-monophosphatase
MIYCLDMTETLQFATDLAHQVGQKLLEKFRSSGLETKLKSDHSVVTEADFTADHLITSAIRENYPDDLILSEELQPGYSSNNLETQLPVWIIDPLDGTTNFSLGLHFWGVLMARIVGGWPETGVMYFPYIDELYCATREKGAFLNGEPIQVEPPNVQVPMSFFACCSRTFRLFDVSVPYKARIFGSAAYTFCTVARGIAVLGFEATPKIWDIAAPWLLVIEAGGVMETLDGSQPFPLKTRGSYDQKKFPTLAGATHDLVFQAHKQITPKRT